MAYVNLTEAEHERLQEEAKIGRDYSARVKSAQLFVLAAAKCGFVDANQYDCIVLALEKLTGLEIFIIELLLHIKPRQMR